MKQLVELSTYSKTSQLGSKERINKKSGISIPERINFPVWVQNVS